MDHQRKDHHMTAAVNAVTVDVLKTARASIRLFQTARTLRLKEVAASRLIAAFKTMEEGGVFDELERADEKTEPVHAHPAGHLTGSVDPDGWYGVTEVI